ncbi:MAG: bifunctional diguanylate cyclase/phosphodiesterase [Pseudomonadota bacterium]
MLVRGVEKRSKRLRLYSIFSAGFGGCMLAVWAMQFGGLAGIGAINLNILAIITAGLTTLAASGAVLAYFAGGDDVITAVEAAALHDAPTGLLSSAGLRAGLPSYCEEVENEPSLDATYIISIEFTGLRQINEYFSDETGDIILRSIAARLRSVVGNAGPIGRTTGGEFVVFLNTGQDLAEIHAAVNGVMRILNQPIKVRGMVHPAYCSCGVALVSSKSVPFDRALRSANVARSNAAEAGLGTWALYHPEMGEAATYNRWLKTELSGAIERNELSLVYQQQCDANSNTVVGYEALLRWNHWRIGAIPPADFIPVAEQSGLIYQIGEWVMRRACSNTKHIPGDVKVSINVSNLQLEQPDFVYMMENILRKENVDTSRIELEMTESVLASNSKRVREHLAWVKERGISVAIDDFGTGYSNLSMLAGFSFDRLKIDKSFIDRLDERGKFGPMVAAIVNLAHTLGATTVAEGVENEVQATLVKAAGCNIIQGYLYGRPKPLEEIIAENDNSAPVIAIDNKILLSKGREQLEAVV